MKEKSIVKNYVFYVSYSLLNIIVPLLTIPYISRVLLATGVGKVSFAQNITTYFILFGSLGISNYGVREIAKNNNDIKSRSTVFFELFTINAVSTLISTVLYYFVACIIFLQRDNYMIYFVMGIMVILNVFNIDWFYRGIEEFKYITIRNFAVKMISIVLIFLFVKQKNDVLIYTLILVFTATVNNVINVIHAKQYVKISACEKLKIRRHIKSIFFLFATAIAVELYTQLDTTMIGMICEERYVGYYTNSIKVIKLIVVLITAIGSVLLPRLSVYFDEGKIDEVSNIVNKSVDYIVLFSLPCMIGISMIADDFVYLMFGSDFSLAIPTMRILSFVILIIALGNIYGTQLMMVFGLEKKLALTVFCGAFTNIILNSFLIPRFNHNGAAFATLLTELVVCMMQMHFSKAYLNKRKEYKSILVSIVSAVVMNVSLLLALRMKTSLILRMVACIISSIFVYLGMNALLKNQIIKDLFDRLKKKY